MRNLVNQMLVDQIGEEFFGPMLEYFQEVKVQTASELILEQIRTLIREGKLKPGDRLPSERALADRFGVGRGPIRDALKKLEFYGILRTEPKKGTTVASLGVKALEGLISSIIGIDQSDYSSLFETRAVLEVHAARMAARRAGEDSLAQIRRAHDEYARRVRSGDRGLEEDHVFHLKIAEASHNSILMSLIGLVTPDVINMNRDFVDREPNAGHTTLDEHSQIVEGIMSGDPDSAGKAMAEHMRRSRQRRFGKPVEEEIL